MIGGIIVPGGFFDQARVLLRCIGPSLANVGVTNALQDPMIELYNGAGVLFASNDNWRSNQQADIIAIGKSAY